MDEEVQRLTVDDRLYRLLDHYGSAVGDDREAWADRVNDWEGGAIDLTRCHGVLLAAAWVEWNARPTATPAAGKVPACYRLTTAGRQVLKRARAVRTGTSVQKDRQA
jgi:hypothetical protein